MTTTIILALPERRDKTGGTPNLTPRGAPGLIRHATKLCGKTAPTVDGLASCLPPYSRLSVPASHQQPFRAKRVNKVNAAALPSNKGKQGTLVTPAIQAEGSPTRLGESTHRGAARQEMNSVHRAQVRYCPDFGHVRKVAERRWNYWFKRYQRVIGAEETVEGYCNR
jgi:hypothetical protein